MYTIRVGACFSFYLYTYICDHVSNQVGFLVFVHAEKDCTADKKGQMILMLLKRD